LVFCGYAVGFRSQPIPENIIGFDRLAGIEALLKKRIELFLGSIEAGGGSGLHNGKGGVESFLGERNTLPYQPPPGSSVPVRGSVVWA
jgi:hypothetical protein